MTPTSPQPTDATLGNNTPAPLTSVTLGGIDGIRQRLANPDLAVRLEALDQAWSYGDAGRVVLKDMLGDRSKTLRRRARWLLRQPQGTTLAPESVWTLTERLDLEGYGSYATRFANREVQTFELNQSVTVSPQLAYALRCGWDDESTVIHKLEALLQQPNADQLTALVIGAWQNTEDICTGESSTQELVENLVTLRDRLPNLKALFLGDITSEESEISWFNQSDISPILQAYPQLEILQIRGGMELEFKTPGTHQHLKALIVETGGLSRETVHQIYAWEFPALEHLELWFGDENYGGDCWNRDLNPILTDLRYPTLTYLGLRNSTFADDMMDMLVRSPLIGGLQVLDLSLGTLGDEGAAKLLDCPAVKDLETLNVSENFLSGARIDQLNALGINVLAVGQEEEYEEEDPKYRRYCSVSE